MYGKGRTVPERNASTEAGLLRKQVHTRHPRYRRAPLFRLLISGARCVDQRRADVLIAVGAAPMTHELMIDDHGHRKVFDLSNPWQMFAKLQWEVDLLRSLAVEG